ncbi:hypothetical protein ACQP2E_27815 [Actinoplanes sp. CA-015351]|uniref:hypothetical protein n=1 Tax=Actinoplanes sp. CA-015351 TaxID=3239897 RepID=UPI003D968CD2
MRKILFAGFGAVMALGALAGPASADVGDGNLACNSGEICFARDATNTTYQKHFWNAGSHSSYTFTNVTNGAGGQGALKDNSPQLKNRDTVCTVKVIDDHGVLPDDVSSHGRSTAWQAINSSVKDQNDRHERC